MVRRRGAAAVQPPGLGQRPDTAAVLAGALAQDLGLAGENLDPGRPPAWPRGLSGRELYLDVARGVESGSVGYRPAAAGRALVILSCADPAGRGTAWPLGTDSGTGVSRVVYCGRIGGGDWRGGQTISALPNRPPWSAGPTQLQGNAAVSCTGGAGAKSVWVYERAKPVLVSVTVKVNPTFVVAEKKTQK